MRERMRRLTPPNGPAYELFDTAATLWIIVLASYWIERPTPTTATALQWLIGPTTFGFWGAFLTLGALLALICSYVPEAVAWGRALTWFIGSLWASVLFLGWLADTDLQSWETVLTDTWPLALATFAFTLGLHVITDNKSVPDALIAAVFATIAVASIVALGSWLGDFRPFASAVIYGFIARQAWHLTNTACVPGEAR